MQGKLVSSILDTGAQINIVSREFANLLSKTPRKLDTPLNLQLADGRTSKVTDGLTLKLLIGSSEFDVDFVIVETFPYSLLLGLEFILSTDVHILPNKNEIWIAGARFLIDPENRNCDKTELKTESLLVVPKGGEIAVTLKCHQKSGLLLCEASEIAETFGLLVAATVSRAKDHHVLVRLANPTSKAVLIPKGTTL